MEPAETLFFGEVESLDDLILAAHQELEDAVMRASNRAFNLGLRTWLIPGGAIIIGVFVLSKANWAMTGITVALIGLAIIVFAIFVASRSKEKSPARIYTDFLSSDVTNKLKDLGHTPEEYAHRALEILPDEALLAQLLRQQEKASDIYLPITKEEIK